MKQLLVVIATIGLVLGGHAQTSTVVSSYIATYREMAINEMIRTGVPASITLAQGILETQAGQSDLVKKSNNHFGIKCKTEWTGGKVYHDDDERGECFRSYASAEESYRDHSDFLKNRPNYAFLFHLDPIDYEGWAKGLKKAGYATSNVYAQMLVKIIADNGLQQYTLIALDRQQHPNQPILANINNDQPAPGRPGNRAAATLAPPQKEHTDSEQVAEQAAVPVATASAVTIQVAQTAIQAPTYPTGVFQINATRVIYAGNGTSLFALANQYNVAFNKLLEFNELAQKDILESSQLIFLERKPKKGAKEVHLVETAETIEIIAQREGVRLNNLLAYNHLSSGLQPLAGEKIYLRANAPATPRTTRGSNLLQASRR